MYTASLIYYFSTTVKSGPFDGCLPGVSEEEEIDWTVAGVLIAAGAFLVLVSVTVCISVRGRPRTAVPHQSHPSAAPGEAQGGTSATRAAMGCLIRHGHDAPPVASHPGRHPGPKAQRVRATAAARSSRQGTRGPGC